MLATGLAMAAFGATACGDDDPVAPRKPAPILRKAVAPEYKDRKPPEGFDLADPANIAAGKVLFEGQPKDGGGNCFSCHGMGGKGDGTQGVGLDPRPTDLTSEEFQASVKVDYIYWRVKTGNVGGPANSAMTGFVGEHPDEKFWQVVAYVRSLRGK